MSSFEAALRGDHTKPLPSELIKEFSVENVIVAIPFSGYAKGYLRPDVILEHLTQPLPKVDEIIFFAPLGLFNGPFPRLMSTGDGTPILYRKIDEARSNGDLAAALANPDYDPISLRILSLTCRSTSMGLASLED